MLGVLGVLCCVALRGLHRSIVPALPFRAVGCDTAGHTAQDRRGGTGGAAPEICEWLLTGMSAGEHGFVR